MDLEIELLSGELQLFKDTILKLTSRFTRLEGFLLSQFGSKFEQYEDNLKIYSGTRDASCSTQVEKNHVSRSSSLSNILSDTIDSNNSDSASETESGDPSQNPSDNDRIGVDAGSNDGGTIEQRSTVKRKRGRPRKHPPKFHETAKADNNNKRCRPPFVKWVLYKTFSDADEAEAYVLSEEQIWSKSFMNKSQQGKKQYFGCRVTRRCPARRALFYRNDNTLLLYKSESGHDHSGVKASRLKRFANILSYEEIEASISQSTPPSQSAGQEDSFLDQQLLELIGEETQVPSINMQIDQIIHN